MKATYTKMIPKTFTKGKWTYEEQSFQVELLAAAKGFVMVRRPRCKPFVARQSELSDLPSGKRSSGNGTGDR